MSQESERRLVAFALADEIAALGLNTGPLGGYDGQAEDAPGKPHIVLLSKAALLDGVIKIYSPRAIQIKWQNGKTPKSVLVKSEEDAKEFLRLVFVENDLEAAMEHAETKE